MTLQTIEPGHAKRLIDQGAVLVDIREPDEHAREHIPGARNLPIAKLAETKGSAENGKRVFSDPKGPGCANCHQIAGVGHVVGPNLQSVANKSPADLLIAILDPNREAQPNFATR